LYFTDSNDSSIIKQYNLLDNTIVSLWIWWWSWFDISPDWNKIIFTQCPWEWNKAFIKNIFESWCWVQLTNNTSYSPRFIDDNNFIYSNWWNNYHIYKKNIFDTWDWIEIVNARSLYSDVYNNILLYSNDDDNDTLYKTDINWWIWIKISNTEVYDLKISPDWNFVFYSNRTDWQYLYKKNINDFLIWEKINQHTTKSISILNDWTTLFYVNGSDNYYLYSINWDFGGIPQWPSPFSLTNSWSILMNDWWVWILWTETEWEYTVDFRLWSHDHNNPPIIALEWSFWSFSWWLHSYDVVYDFESLKSYSLDLIFKDLNDPENIVVSSYDFIYSFNGWFVDPSTLDYSFFHGGYTFWANWFTFNSFVPDPYWWDLFFEIIAPDWNSWTWIIYTHKIWWEHYWFDYSLKFTTPYHEVAWVYQVRAIYNYNWEQVFVDSSWNYQSYNISVPEVVDYSPWAEYNEVTSSDRCDADSDDTWIIPWLSQFFWCSVSVMVTWLDNINTAYQWLRELIYSIWNFWNIETTKNIYEAFINFDFFPTAYATETYVYNESQDPLKIISNWSFEDIPLLNNIYNLLKYTIILVIFLIGWSLIFKSRENG
jgi:hypothetical protein